MPMKLSALEVRRTIAADFKRKGITYETAAQQLGYKNKQTVANILTGSRKEYMTVEQAFRFHSVYNYQTQFLISGEGTLYEPKPRPFDGLIEITSPLKGLPPEALFMVIDIAEGIIKTCRRPEALSAWNNVLNGDYYAYFDDMTLLANNDISHRVIPQLARYTCELIKENNDSNYYSEYLYGPQKDH